MDAFEKFKNLISNINIEPSHVICILIVALVFVIEIILIKKGILNFNPNKRKMQKAIQLNHIIKARRVSFYDDDTTGYDVHSWYHAKYEYILNGKNKIYKYLSKKHPPLEITWYYTNNPKKIFHYEDKTSPLFILIYIIPFVITAIIMNLLGITIN